MRLNLEQKYEALAEFLRARPIHVLVDYVADWKWTAHCLDFDIVGEGNSKDTAKNDLREKIQIAIDYVALNDVAPESLKSRAPTEYWDRFSQLRESESGATTPTQWQFERGQEKRGFWGSLKRAISRTRSRVLITKLEIRTISRAKAARLLAR